MGRQDSTANLLQMPIASEHLKPKTDEPLNQHELYTLQTKRIIAFHCPKDLGLKEDGELEEDELCKRINRGLLGVTECYDINKKSYGVNAFAEKKASRFGSKRKPKAKPKADVSGDLEGETVTTADSI